MKEPQVSDCVVDKRNSKHYAVKNCKQKENALFLENLVKHCDHNGQVIPLIVHRQKH